MTRAASRHRYTIEEYLRLERDALEKHEFDDGEILAMAGATRVHVLISTNTLVGLHNRLRGKPCVPYGTDLRIRTSGRPKFVYPDISVICGEPIADPDDGQGETFLNPRLIVEVLSPSTERYDRQEKFDRYRGVESFREYVLVSQDQARVETFHRQADGTWAFNAFTGLDATVRLRSLGDLDLPLAEVYAGVEFPPVEPSVAAPDADE